MRITSITASGVPRGPWAVEFPARVTAIIGPNESGKSTLLGLVDLVLDGPRGKRWPVLGDDPGDFVAALALDEGPRVERERYRGNHYLDCDGVGKTRTGGKLADGQQAIDALVGPTFSFSMSDLEAMSPDAALKWLESTVLEAGGEDLSGEVAEHVEAVNRVAGYEQDDEALVDGDPIDRAALTAILEDIGKADSEAHRDALRLRKVCAQDQEEAKAAELPTGTVDEWRGKRDALTAEIGEVQGRIGKVEQAQEDGAQLVRRSKVLQNVVDKGRWVDLAALKARHDDEVAPLLIEAEERVQAAQEAEQADRIAADALEEARVAFEREEAGCQAREEQIGDLGERLTALQTAGVVSCPECAADISSALEAQLAGQIAEMEKANREARADDGGIRLEYQEAKLPAAKAHRSLEVALAEQRKAAAALEKMKRGHEAAMVSAESEIQKAVDAAAELEQVNVQIDAIPTDAELPALREQLADLQKRHTEAEKAADTLSDDAQAREQRERHRLEWDQAVRRRDEARGLLKALGPQGVLGRALEGLVAPLVEQVSTYLRPVTGSTLTVSTEGGLALGYERSTKGYVLERCPLSEASRSHRAVLLSILGTVIRSKVGEGLRLVRVDDVENLEAERRDRFLDALRAMVKDGILDQAIVACVADGWRPKDQDVGVVLLGS